MLIRLAALGALGYAGYRYYEKNRDPARASDGGGTGPDTWDSAAARNDAVVTPPDPTDPQ